MSAAPLLLEVGCEEIPARMIPSAVSELARRCEEILDRAGLAHGRVAAWGGSRRLAVRLDNVADRQEDREQLVVGPPAAVAFDSAGKATAAGLGFARKVGAPADRLTTIDNDKGTYAALRRTVSGRSIAEILADALPAAVAGMAFPKTMRWGEGEHRWVRPVHWLVALHGSEVLPLELFGIQAGRDSVGHRFLGRASVPILHPDDYAAVLESACVLVDPAERRKRLAAELERAAGEGGGRLIQDAALLDEVVDLVEWPGVVAGRIDPSFLDLPRELLVTTLRHHQKCFSVEGARGELRPAFLAVTNTNGDPSGHVRRGNEWVVSGRLEDARFFWKEDRRLTLAARLPRLEGVAFHTKCGSYASKAERIANLAEKIARSIGLGEEDRDSVREASRLCKADLVTSLVGEFPELQGVIGGLLLEREGAPPAVARGVYEHYRPVGASDPIPDTVEGSVVAIADRLDTVAQLISAGERPTGSRDPLGLRRSANGIFRTVLGRSWSLSMQNLSELAGDATVSFLLERLQAFFRDEGYTPKEISAVFQPRISDTAVFSWTLPDIKARLDAIKGVRGRDDFRQLVKLVERVDNIVVKNPQKFLDIVGDCESLDYQESEIAALELERLLMQQRPVIDRYSHEHRYGDILTVLAKFVQPVDRFFQEVLVLDSANPAATSKRRELLVELKDILTRSFDIRELAGQADKRGA